MSPYSSPWYRLRQERHRLHPLYRSYLARLHYYLQARSLELRDQVLMERALVALARSGERKKHAPERCFGASVSDFAPALLGRIQKAGSRDRLLFYLRSLTHALLFFPILVILNYLASRGASRLWQQSLVLHLPACLCFYTLSFPLFHLLRRSYRCRRPVWLWRCYLGLSLLGFYFLFFWLPTQLLPCGLLPLQSGPLLICPLALVSTMEVLTAWRHLLLARELGRQTGAERQQI